MLGLLLGLAAAVPPTVGVGRIDVALDPKVRIGPRSAGLLCAPNGDIRWRRDLTEADFASAPLVLLKTVESAGLRTTDDPAGLFAGMVEPANYLIGGRVTVADGDICVPSRGAPIFLGSRVTAESGAKGRLAFQVEWQVYSIHSRRVVFRRATDGEAILTRKTAGGVRILAHDALSNSLRDFLGRPDALALLKSPLNPNAAGTPR